MGAAPANPFWDFSLAVYQRRNVAGPCMALQDRLQLDVNMLLFCCWTGQRGHQLSEQQVREALAAIDVWQGQVVAPLRRLRRLLKASLDLAPERRQVFRDKLKDLELDAERVEQDILIETVPLTPGATSGAEVAALNLSTYLLVKGVDLGEGDLAQLGTLLDTIFPNETAGG
ncbi:MAG: TIGR02444 family protein [Kiloniellales bacterium]|nr:TIGR02444 family protein [Kiloniellales bacterium]